MDFLEEGTCKTSIYMYILISENTTEIKLPFKKR